MDSQIPRQQGQVIMEGGEEKPSMLKKMKAKARKMKDTIKMKTGKDQDVDNNNRSDQGRDEEEDGDQEYEDMVEEPEVHDAVPSMILSSHDQFSPEPIPPTSTLNSDDPGSVLKSFDADHKPEEDTTLDNVTNLPSNQSTYTEKLSYATHTIVDSAIAAKNVVASKLGYGNTEDPTATSPKTTQGGEEETGKPGYGQKVVATVTEKLAPVYEKVSRTGSLVVSKVRGTGTKQDEGEGRGVSVKEHLAEKLRPSDEDKALSGFISDTSNNRKLDVDGEEEENQKPTMGTVTESKEVRERLGSDEDNREMTETESQVADNVNATGKSMVESVKSTVTSWFSMGGSPKQNSEASPGTVPATCQLLLGLILLVLCRNYP